MTTLHRSRPELAPPRRGPSMLAGARAMAPMLIGIAPFGLTIGATVAESDVPDAAGFWTGPLIFSGGSQLATVELLGAGAAPAVVVATAVALNLRLLLYGASIGPHWRHLPLAWKLAASSVLVEPTYAVGMRGYGGEHPGAAPHAFYLGAAVALWVTWHSALAAGIALGARLPEGLGLRYAVPIFLVAELAPRLRARPAQAAALGAAVLAAAGTALPFRAGLLAGIAAGLAAGMAAEGVLARRSGMGTP